MDLLENHIHQTRDTFREIKKQLGSIENKIDDLSEFRIKSITETRTVSFIVSAVCGFITLVSTMAVAYFSVR